MNWERMNVATLVLEFSSINDMFSMLWGLLTACTLLMLLIHASVCDQFRVTTLNGYL